MTPTYADPWLQVYEGDCRAVLAELPAESVHCVVTSPPYWGLRDYGTPGQLGLEPTPEEYVENMVAVFREVRRVLRADGTVWLNLGDSWASTGYKTHAPKDDGQAKPAGWDADRRGFSVQRTAVGRIKPKDRVMMPARVAIALQEDGWWLRDEIVWQKPNPMPSSVTDWTTPAHEMIYLLSKRPTYYFDNDAVREEASAVSLARIAQATFDQQTGGPKDYRNGTNPNRSMRQTLENFAANPGRNLRSVWNIATQPYPGAHFATFPEKLVEPCVKAGTSERGVCPECGAPWRRDVAVRYDSRGRTTNGPRSLATREITAGFGQRLEKRVDTLGWRASCTHADRGETNIVRPPAVPIPATVLDPFAGSGTTGRVDQRLGRRAILIDLNGEYLRQAMERNRDVPLGLGA